MNTNDKLILATYKKLQTEQNKTEQQNTVKKKNKNLYSKLLVAFIVLINVIFTASVFIVFVKTKNEPSTLIGAWFSFTTIELWNLAKIKRQKIKEEN